jgi:hypothetical protein
LERLGIGPHPNFAASTLLARYRDGGWNLIIFLFI